MSDKDNLKTWPDRIYVPPSRMFKVSAQQDVCSTHPDATHGFERNASHSADRYVCECEGWQQEPVSEQAISDSEMLDFLDSLLQRSGGGDMYFAKSGVSLFIRTGVGANLESHGQGNSTREAIIAAMGKDKE